MFSYCDISVIGYVDSSEDFPEGCGKILPKIYEFGSRLG